MGKGGREELKLELSGILLVCGCARDRSERSADMGKTCQVLTNMGITICFAEERFVQNRRLSYTVETWELNLRSENRE